jgi:hypothetical protein
MELVEGPTLADRILGCDSFKEALGIARQIEMLSKPPTGIVHRL